MIIISGVMPGVQGVGRLLSLLVRESSEFSKESVRFVFGLAGTAGGKALRKGQIFKFVTALWKIFLGKIHLSHALHNSSIYDTNEPVMLIHFQTLGYNWCRRFVKKRSKATWLYLMDCGYFCIRSYNHIPGEEKACLRCLGGQWQHARECGCKPIPFTNFQALQLVKKLKKWVQEGKIKLLVQNRLQADLVKRHFGNHIEAKVVGLWTADLPEHEEITYTKPIQNNGYDVVYHASSLPAKGFIWSINLARHCQGLKFLFPCFKTDSKVLNDGATPNASFNYMTWETGLAEAVRNAKIVLVPSLWSATIEGALLKSIIFSRAVAVADEPTAFAAELPDKLILRLPRDVRKAADVLSKAIESQWMPSDQLHRVWINNFYSENKKLLNKLLAVCQEESLN